MRRVISGKAGLLFKGDGFYLTDYTSYGKEEGAKPSARKEGGGEKADAKPAEAAPKADAKSESSTPKASDAPGSSAPSGNGSSGGSSSVLRANIGATTHSTIMVVGLVLFVLSAITLGRVEARADSLGFKLLELLVPVVLIGDIERGGVIAEAIIVAADRRQAVGIDHVAAHAAVAADPLPAERAVRVALGLDRGQLEAELDGEWHQERCGPGRAERGSPRPRQNPRSTAAEPDAARNWRRAPHHCRCQTVSQRPVAGSTPARRVSIRSSKKD